jgi:hypothetical protein
MSAMATIPSSSIHAINGTIAHEVASFYLMNGFWGIPEDYNLSMSELDIMVKDISVYTDYIERIRLNEPNCTVHIEHSFDMDAVYPGAYGTADCVVYDPIKKHLKVIDYKHGKGIIVEVENNSQLLYYALGAVTTLKYPFNSLELVVVQPRAFHAKGPIRNWIIGVEEIIDFRADLIEAAKRTEEKNPYFEAGDHCFFCGAIDICPKSETAKSFKRMKVMMPLFKTTPQEDFKPVGVVEN